MKTALFLLLLSIGVIGSTQINSTQPNPTQRLEYEDLGIVLEIPDTWENTFYDMLTKRGKYAQMGEKYEGADSLSIMQAFLHFQELEVDSTLLPAVEAYDFHNLSIKINGSYGWYDRWLWSQGKTSLFEHFTTLTGMAEAEEFTVINEEVLSGDDGRKIIKEAYAIEYEYKKKEAQAASKGQIYWVVRGERCYRIQLEGVSLHYEENRQMYEAVLASMQI